MIKDDDRRPTDNKRYRSIPKMQRFYNLLQ